MGGDVSGGIANDPVDRMDAGPAGGSRGGGGETVYRAYGDKAKPLGNYWTTTDPSTVTNFRSAAGLPDGNAGRFIIEGKITNATGIIRGTATAIGTNPGGLPQIIIPNPSTQIEIISVKGVNPEF